jgi:cytochrome c biogenesis protein CcdA
MLGFLSIPAVLAVAVYAARGDAALSGILTFGFVLFLALCVMVIYALAARAKRHVHVLRQRTERQKHEAHNDHARDADKIN